MIQKFTIPGQPVAQARPRFAMRGGFSRVYDDPKSREYKQFVALSVRSQGAVLTEGPVRVSMTFYMKRPKSLPKKVNLHVKKPDIDNLTKAILDGCNGELWNDDSQVCSLLASKVYTVDEPGVEMTVEELNG